jgi:hypothetical protein
VDAAIAAIVGRPALMGHVGEYIASQVFGIALQASAAARWIDGQFVDGALRGRSVNVKWYGQRDGLLDLHPSGGPDFYLIMTGPKGSGGSSRGAIRPWTIEAVFLFEAAPLLAELRRLGVKIGTATSVRAHLWDAAELFPQQRNGLVVLSSTQREALGLFR